MYSRSVKTVRTNIFAKKNAYCLKLQLLILFFVKSIISDMHHRITYMYINFQQNQVCRSVKTCTLIYLHNIYRSCINLQLPIAIIQIYNTHLQFDTNVPNYISLLIILFFIIIRTFWDTRVCKNSY